MNGISSSVIGPGVPVIAAGTATLVAGSVTVSTTAIQSSSKILLSHNALGGTAGTLYTSNVVAGTSFKINSTSGTDTSTVAWAIL